MSRNPTLTQLKKYDTTQKVMEALADAESRAILFSTVSRGKAPAELSHDLKIPLSSVYKKLSVLGDLSLIAPERIIISESGSRYKIFRSRISAASISIKKPEPVLNLVPN